jgi:hypothetical protein
VLSLKLVTLAAFNNELVATKNGLLPTWIVAMTLGAATASGVANVSASAPSADMTPIRPKNRR